MTETDFSENTMLAQEATDATATKEIPNTHQGRKIGHQGGQTLEEVPGGPVGFPSLEALGTQLPRP